jgi:hypothetical protein
VAWADALASFGRTEVAAGIVLTEALDARAGEPAAAFHVAVVAGGVPTCCI